MVHSIQDCKVRINNFNFDGEEYNKEFLDLLEEMDALSRKGIYKKEIRIIGASKAHYFVNKLVEMKFKVFLWGEREAILLSIDAS